MKAHIKLFSGRHQSSREFIYDNPLELIEYLKQLHSVEPNGWIAYSIEEDKIVERDSEMVS